jgi:hypothetical protein
MPHAGEAEGIAARVVKALGFVGKAETIPDDGGLFRRIHPSQVICDKNLGRYRPASGAFKDKEMSVDAESILHANGLDWTFSLRNSPGFSLARFTAYEARANGLKVVHTPRPEEQPDNPAHTEVIGSTDATARRLVVVCTWIHLVEPKK